MTPHKSNAEEKAIEALIGASLCVPGTEEEIRDDEIKRYVEQGVTLSPEYKAALDQSKPGFRKALKWQICGQPQREQQHASAKHSKGIFFRRAAFDTYVINALGNDPNLGRTKIEKITHLTEYHCGVDFEREPIRDAAGPVDYVSRRKVESLGRKLQWYSVVESSERWGVKYQLGPQSTQALAVAVAVLGKRKGSVDALIDLMSPLNTRTCEIVATLYSAWNDLLLAGRCPEDSEILFEARENWHSNKLSIPVGIWATALQWMRDKAVVPHGQGRPVRRP